LLSYIEQGPLYNSINFMIGNRATYPSNLSAHGVRINAFLCPSSPLPRGSLPGCCCLLIKPPGNNYFASVGPSIAYQSQQGPGQVGTIGLFGYDWDARYNVLTSGGGFASAAPIGPADIVDGTSNTIAFGEFRGGDWNCAQLSVPQDVINHITWPSIPFSGPWVGPQLQTFMAWLNSCAAAAPASILNGGNNWQTNQSFLGASWDQGLLGYSLGNTMLAPNPPIPNCRVCSWNGDWDCPMMAGLSSFHPGGCNVAMADGSVRFLKSSMQMQVVWYLGTKSGGEVVSADQY
jgi:prepilin-type processing-associated H-X9-DG protein